MNKAEIFAHWKGWATEHGTGLKATTKTPTVKMLELDALSRHLRSAGLGDSPGRVLEIGCGNGVNCVGLATAFPHLVFDGVDYVPEMVDAAKATVREKGLDGRLNFFRGDALDLNAVEGLSGEYDAVFTDRCFINLNTLDDQLKGIAAASGKVQKGGHLLMIENSAQTHGMQNLYREYVGLPRRASASYNLFFDEGAILSHLDALGMTVEIEDFVSLHDLVLYVLVPAVNGGEVDYEHPLVEVATRLSMAISAETPNTLGAHGQNRLFHCHKE